MSISPYVSMLVGTDGSITANRAVQRAADLAAASATRLLVAYVGEAELGRTVIEQVEAQYGGEVDLETHLLTGDPADALLGSVPNKVSHQATCDVLIVHTTAQGG